MIKIIFGLLFSILFLTDCNQGNTSKEGKSNLIKSNLISDSIQQETNSFYRRRNYNVAWFNKDGISYAVSIHGF